MTQDELIEQINNTKSAKRRADLIRHMKKMVRKGEISGGGREIYCQAVYIRRDDKPSA